MASLSWFIWPSRQLLLPLKGHGRLVQRSAGRGRDGSPRVCEAEPVTGQRAGISNGARVLKWNCSWKAPSRLAAYMAAINVKDGRAILYP